MYNFYKKYINFEKLVFKIKLIITFIKKFKIQFFNSSNIYIILVYHSNKFIKNKNEITMIYKLFLKLFLK